MTIARFRSSLRAHVRYLRKRLGIGELRLAAAGTLDKTGPFVCDSPNVVFLQQLSVFSARYWHDACGAVGVIHLCLRDG